MFSSDTPERGCNLNDGSPLTFKIKISTTARPTAWRYWQNSKLIPAGSRGKLQENLSIITIKILTSFSFKRRTHLFIYSYCSKTQQQPEWGYRIRYSVNKGEHAETRHKKFGLLQHNSNIVRKPQRSKPSTKLLQDSILAVTKLKDQLMFEYSWLNKSNRCVFKHLSVHGTMSTLY